MLNSEGVCFRTEVAIRKLTMETSDWKKFMAGINIHDEHARENADVLVQNRILLPYMEEVEEALQHLQKSSNAIPPGPKQTLIKRWTQIKTIIQQCLQETTKT